MRKAMAVLGASFDVELITSILPGTTEIPLQSGDMSKDLGTGRRLVVD